MKRDCTTCGKGFEAERKTARYCSSSCRVVSHRRRKRAAAPDAEVVPLLAGLLGAVTRQLTEARKLDTYTGQQALVVATRLQASGQDDSGSAVAALSRELERLMTVLLAEVRPEPDAIDQAQAIIVQLRTPRRRPPPRGIR